ncbi:ATP-binding protein [Sediminibacterium roseum]|uniref:ATP-binding protein n=1 Tax=Sediminibacterium roseum TaxID=1978412 RepID=A0ABX0A0C9_9BACT|nr:ATP-binding protein [Sediminibacterium roseum]NCI51402.1 ATP-binding protein [Sediminibacterium roseum]
MTLQNITDIVSSQIQMVLDGQESEYPKLDFKRQWYNLFDELSINEFLKDSSAMANSPGLDGFIVIGFDQKQKDFQKANFTDCGLRDENELTGLINRRVDRVFHISHYPIQFKGTTLSVLHIPPSFDKPHVIRNYKTKKGEEQQHRVFTKSGSNTKLATKYDFDFIAFDRANHIPEYDLQLSFSPVSYGASFIQHDNTAVIQLTMSIENTGRRAVSIHEIILTFENKPSKPFEFVSTSSADNKYNSLIKVSNIIIPPGHIQLITDLTFKSIDRYAPTVITFLSQLSLFPEITAIIKLTSGSEIKTRVNVIS